MSRTIHNKSFPRRVFPGNQEQGAMLYCLLTEAYGCEVMNNLPRMVTCYMIATRRESTLHISVQRI